jgi:predicted porin
MKNILVKTSLALAIAAATAPVASVSFAEGAEAPGVTVSGRFRGGLVYDDRGNDTEGWNLQNRSSRFRIAASQDLGNGVSAFGKYEFAVDLDEGSLVANRDTQRLSYVGLKGGFGEVSIGSRWTPFYNAVTSPIDATNLLGGTWQTVGYISPFRRPDQVMYKYSGGWGNVAASFSADEDPDVADDPRVRGGNDFADTVSVAGTFGMGPVSLGLGYESYEDGPLASSGNLQGIRESLFGINGTWNISPNSSVGLSWFSESMEGSPEFDAGNLDATFDGDNQAWTLQGIWGFGNRMSIIGQYGVSLPDDDSTLVAEPTYFALELGQKLSDHTRWFAGVEFTDPDSNALDDRSRYGLGMRLDF